MRFSRKAIEVIPFERIDPSGVRGAEPHGARGNGLAAALARRSPRFRVLHGEFGRRHWRARGERSEASGGREEEEIGETRVSGDEGEVGGENGHGRGRGER